jgi:hypothetical protein
MVSSNIYSPGSNGVRIHVPPSSLNRRSGGQKAVHGVVHEAQAAVDARHRLRGISAGMGAALTRSRLNGLLGGNGKTSRKSATAHSAKAKIFGVVVSPY